MAGQRKKPTDLPTATRSSGGENAGGEASSGVENVDKIRDILFGNQMRDYERKFTRLEERIMKEVTRLREESSKRLNDLEGYVNKEIGSLGARLKNEQNDRAEGEKRLADELSKAIKLMEKKLTEMDNQFDDVTRELRQQILDQSKTLSEEIGRKYDETSNALDRTAGELREDKVDRSALSGLLTELALRLSDTSMLSQGESGGLE